MSIRRTTLFSATLGEDGRTEPPLGPLYVAGALEASGWLIDFRDYQLFSDANIYDPEMMYASLRNHEQVVMVSCFVDMLPVVIAATGLLKAERPDAYIILGGPGPTAGAAEIMKAFPHIDAIVRGEGEATIREWAEEYAAGGPPRAIAGMVLRHDQTILIGSERVRLTEGEIARPAYHLLDWSRYAAARIVTTRGCPYHCSFCDVAPLWGRRATYRDIRATVEEVIHIRDEYGITNFAIADDTFVLNRDRVKEFCLLLMERRAGVEWGCFGRINLMSEELISLMAEAGCRGIFYGIDSGSPNVLRRTHKELEVTSILPTLRVSAQYFEFVEASFIWGYPFESLSDFLQTLDLAAAASYLAPVVNVQLHLLSPLPSSPMYQGFVGDLLEPDADDKRWLLLPGVMLDPRASRLRNLVMQHAELFPGFFTFPTPDKEAKVELLNDVVSAIEQTIGRVMVQERVHKLLSSRNRQVEEELLSQAVSASERIGTGLALGVFRRARHKYQETKPNGVSRPPALARQRSDTPVFNIL